MPRSHDIAEIVTAAHTLTRLAALQTKNDSPAAKWRALSVLSTDGPLRLGALATASRTTQPGMTKLVGAMEKEGLVRRDGDPSDSRATVISVTAQGRTALADWRLELRDALMPLFADLGDDEWATLSRAARILTSHTTLQGAAE
ncbi:MarR family winged helix-turn-helix transcriptional regulator [Microbacterium elymi]|uniref:MarR family transcriptional regulator n=1 Tax=Microbacterium elymi TaxID=2909587 RepID=A0ABY5NJX1_9MICO|nr:MULTISPECIES: MarR family transcriptional regulator [Microbacterium]UUT35472.1 MarR family transcriptional regulator [Microbacterium elymi]